MTQEKNIPPKRGRFSAQFLTSLTKGKHVKIIEAIIADPQLDIQLRDNYINVYYEGGNILRIAPRSYQFDEFYFYDKSKTLKKYPKTHLQMAAKGKGSEIPAGRNKPSEKEAIAIINSLYEQKNELMKIIDINIDEYFSKAKQVMDYWFKANPKKERKDQHTIAINNRTFASDTDLVVVDLEFAVSQNHDYNHTCTGNGKKVCRFDIIAVDRNGQLYVLELKQNKNADDSNKKANVAEHERDFLSTVGADDAQSFVDEISDLISIKQQFGILSSDVKLEKSNRPIFAVAYSGDDAESFNEKYDKAGVKVVKIIRKDTNYNNQISLKL